MNERHPTNTVMYFRDLPPELVRMFKKNCIDKDETHKAAFIRFMRSEVIPTQGASVDDQGFVSKRRGRIRSRKS